MLPLTHAENIFLHFPREISSQPLITDYSFWPGMQQFASLDPVPLFQQSINSTTNPDVGSDEQKSISAAEQRNFPSDGFPKILRPSILSIAQDHRIPIPDLPIPKIKDPPISPQSEEPVKKSISFWSSRKEMEKFFDSPAGEVGGHPGDEGLQIVQYFNCLNFIQIQNVVMSVWCLIGWIPHAVNVWDKLKVRPPLSPPPQ